MGLHHTPLFPHTLAFQSLRQMKKERGALVSTEARLACPVGIPRKTGVMELWRTAVMGILNENVLSLHFEMVRVAGVAPATFPA